MTRVQWRQRLAQASVNKSLNTPTIFGHNRSNTTDIFISLHRIQVEGVESGFLQRVVIVTQNRHPSGFDVELGAFREREADPTRDKATIEVTMGDNHNISRSLTFLLPFPVIFTDIADDTVNASSHLFDRFAVGATILPDFPVGSPGVDLVGLESFVISIVPFTNEFRDDVIRCLRKVVR